MRSPATTAETAAESLREALALWRGSPLADFAYAPFAQAAIARLEELRLAAIELRIEADLGARAPRPPRRASCRRSFARTRCASGCAASYARAVPRRPPGRGARGLPRGRRRLVDEVGLEPGPDLQELERRILAQDPACCSTVAVGPRRAARGPRAAARGDATLDALVELAEPLAARGATSW